MVTQGSADGLDGYDIVASARVVGKDLCLIEGHVEASIFNVELSRLTDLLDKMGIEADHLEFLGTTGGICSSELQRYK